MTEEGLPSNMGIARYEYSYSYLFLFNPFPTGQVVFMSHYGFPFLSYRGAIVLPPLWFTIEAGCSFKLEMVWVKDSPSMSYRLDESDEPLSLSGDGTLTIRLFPSSSPVTWVQLPILSSMEGTKFRVPLDPRK